MTHCFIFATMGVGARNTLYTAVAYPTESGNFLCLSVFGRGAVVISRKAKAAGMAVYMFLTPRPSYDRRKSRDGYQSHTGDETMSHSIAEKSVSNAARSVTSEVDFDRYHNQYFFSTNAGLELSAALSHASNLLGGVKQIIQTEAEADMYNGGQGITDAHYMLMATLDAISALINAAEMTVRGMK